MSSTDEKIGIVIAGHANTGKTTLIRTLMKSPVGEVSDRANVTKKGDVYFYEGLQADFIDTPGFRYANIYNLYLDSREEDSNYQMPEKWHAKIELDLEAIEAVKRSSVAIYLGSLSVVPDESHIEELEAVQRLQPRVVGVLNQYRRQLKASSRSEVEKRIDQWKKVFYSHGVTCVINFDAHWDNFAKVTEIYDGIIQSLDSEDVVKFQAGLDSFRERQLQIRNHACDLLLRGVSRLKEVKVVCKKSAYSEDKARKEIKEKAQDITIVFTQKVTDLYQISAQYPSATAQQIKGLFNSRPNYSARIGVGFVGVGVFGGGAAALGALVGGAIAGIFSLGAGAGVGAAFGGIVGAGLGGLSAFDDDNDEITMCLKQEELEECFKIHLALIWILSISGYGRGRKLTEDDMRNILQEIEPRFPEGLLSLPLGVTGSEMTDHDGTISDVAISECARMLEGLDRVWAEDF